MLDQSKVSFRPLPRTEYGAREPQHAVSVQHCIDYEMNVKNVNIHSYIHLRLLLKNVKGDNINQVSTETMQIIKIQWK